MNAEQSIYWHQGLLLQPQHLQHTDRFHERRRSRHRDIDLPHNWGIVSVAIAETALGSGRFVPEQLSAVFKDGTLVEYPGNALIEPRAFALEELAGGGRTVYVGVRQLLPGRSNMSMFETLDAAAHAATRFATLAEPESMPDLLTAEGEAGGRAMYYVLRLFWDNEVEALSGYDLLPLARIERNADTTRLGADFFPPALHIGACARLVSRLHHLCDELAVRAKQLEVYKRPTDGGFAELDTSQWRAFQAMVAMNRYAPWLGHLIETAQSHPWHVYGALRQLVGELSAFSLRCDALGLSADGKALVPAYRHDESGAQISAIIALIDQLLNEITLGPEQLVRFERDGEFWHAELSEAMTSARSRYYLVINGPALPDNVGEQFPRDAKFGASSLIEKLVMLSLPGIELLSLPAAPAGMPRRQGSAFFRVETVSDAWQAVIHERSVSLFCPQLLEYEPVMIELAIVRK